MSSRFRSFVILVSLLFLFGTVPLSSRAAAEVVVKIGTVVPDGSIWHLALKQLASEWRQATAGRVALRIFAGTQGDEPTMIRKMRIDQLQAASLTSIGLGDIDAAFDVFGIPMFYASYEELHHVMEQLEPMLKTRLEAEGFILLHWGDAGWVQVFGKQPVKSVDDLKKLKIFTSAGDDRMVQWYKQNGFQPVPLALTDMLTSLQTGMIDAIPATPLAALAFQWYRHTPHMLEAGLGPLIGATVMTRKAWNEVAPEDRAKLVEAAEKSEARLRAEVPKQDRAAVAEMQKRGLTVTPPDASRRDEWAGAAEKFATSMRGSMVPADVFDAALRERDAFRKRGGAGGQP